MQQPKDVKKNDWPYNLLEAIGCESDDPLDHISDEAEMELILCMSRLTDREKLVIRRRFFDQKTLREVATDIGTQGERARQIEAKALRKLRNPYDASGFILRHGVKAYIEMRVQEKVDSALQAKEAELVKAYQEKMVELDKEAFEKERDKMDSRAKTLSMEITELDLSVRAYNCMARARCKTVGDIITMYPTYNEACNIRNFGRRSMEEVSHKLSKLGIQWPKEVE